MVARLSCSLWTALCRGRFPISESRRSRQMFRRKSLLLVRSTRLRPALEAMTLPADLLAKIDEVIPHYPVSKRSATLPLLHLWQEHFGFISDAAIAWIAAKLELEPVHVLELVTFYPMYRRQPAGQTH